jgi:transposase
MDELTTDRHYEQLLGLVAPWRVTDVRLDAEAGDVEVHIACPREVELACPSCGAVSPRYDSRERRWRHLDTMQYRTVLIAEVPRVRCERHGVHQVAVGWAEDRSRFTVLFETQVIDWLHEASLSAVARRLRLTWDQVSGIQARAVGRGLARRAALTPTRIGIDETSFQKRHEYVTVVNDLERGCVLYVADGRSQEALDRFYAGLGEAGCARLDAIVMDMWRPYINSTHAHVAAADAKIVFDKFHIAQHLGSAVDLVRRAEQRALRAVGDRTLAGTRYAWLTNPKQMSAKQRRSFAELRSRQLKVARAWAIKELAMSLWGYVRRGWAERRWTRWYAWAIRSRLEPIKQVARLIKRHWQGVINAATSNVTNALSEGINSKIQWIKRMAHGYRNRDRFRDAIYFHLGGLDLYPDPT